MSDQVLAQVLTMLQEQADQLKQVRAELAALRTQKKAPTKRLLSQRDAATALGIGRDTLGALIHDRKLRTTKVNGVPKVPATEVDRLLAEGFDTRTS